MTLSHCLRWFFLCGHFLYKKFRGNIIPNFLFIDQTVYGAFQNFRLILSAKFSDIGRRHFNLYLSVAKREVEHSSISEHIFKRSLTSYPALIQTKPHQIISWKSGEQKNSRAVAVNSLFSIHLGIPLFRSPAVSQVLVCGEKMFPNAAKYFSENIAKTWPLIKVTA